jgi:hypothetical protein
VPQRSFTGGAAEEDVHMANASITVKAHRDFIGSP